MYEIVNQGMIRQNNTEQNRTEQNRRGWKKEDDNKEKNKVNHNQNKEICYIKETFQIKPKCPNKTKLSN